MSMGLGPFPGSPSASLVPTRTLPCSLAPQGPHLVHSGDSTQPVVLELSPRISNHLLGTHPGSGTAQPTMPGPPPVPQDPHLGNGSGTAQPCQLHQLIHAELVLIEELLVDGLGLLLPRVGDGTAGYPKTRPGPAWGLL